MKNEEFEKLVNTLFDIKEHTITVNFTKPSRLTSGDKHHKVSLKKIGQYGSSNNTVIKGIYLLAQRIYSVQILKKLLNTGSPSETMSFSDVEDMVFFLDTFADLLKKLTKKSLNIMINVSYLDEATLEEMKILKEKSSINKVKYIMADKLFAEKYTAKAMFKVNSSNVGTLYEHMRKVIKKVNTMLESLGTKDTDWQPSKQLAYNLDAKNPYMETFTVYLNKEDVDMVGVLVDPEYFTVTRVEVIHGFH